MEKNEIFCDGGLININQFLARGQAVTKVNHSKNERLELYLNSNQNTSQEAEIFALFVAICEAIRTNKKIIKSDSQFVINSILKDWNIKEERLKLSILILRSLIKHYKIDLVWIRREENLST